jgi:hypothetical protein
MLTIPRPKQRSDERNPKLPNQLFADSPNSCAPHAPIGHVKRLVTGCIVLSVAQIRCAGSRLTRRVAGDFGAPLQFPPFDWVDIVDAAPIPVGVNFGATRHRQIIEQGGQGAFRTVESYYLCPAEPRLPLALAASNLNRRTGLVCEPIMGFLSRLPTITIVEAAPPPPHPGARISQNVSPPMFGRGLL